MDGDVSRYGMGLRESSHHGPWKAVLCPYWQRTTHGTIRCEYVDMNASMKMTEMHGTSQSATSQYSALNRVWRSPGSRMNAKSVVSARNRLITRMTC